MDIGHSEIKPVLIREFLSCRLPFILLEGAM